MLHGSVTDRRWYPEWRFHVLAVSQSVFSHASSPSKDPWRQGGLRHPCSACRPGHTSSGDARAADTGRGLLHSPTARVAPSRTCRSRARIWSRRSAVQDPGQQGPSSEAQALRARSGRRSSPARESCGAARFSGAARWPCPSSWDSEAASRSNSSGGGGGSCCCCCCNSGGGGGGGMGNGASRNSWGRRRYSCEGRKAYEFRAGLTGKGGDPTLSRILV